MAEKRMFSLQIVDTDAFLDMPLSSQALYFHLSMRADDDGFVSSPKKIMRDCHACQNDYDVLMIKKFIIPFDSGICVIKHWRINNYIQSDRYRPTAYSDEMNSLDVKENKSYTLKQPLDTVCIQNVSALDTQIRLDKSRLDKSSIEIKNERPQAGYDDIFSKSKFASSESVKTAVFDFVKMRKLIKKPMTDNAFSQLLTELLRLSGGDEEKAISILNQSIFHNWQGIFELKGENGKQNNESILERIARL